MASPQVSRQLCETAVLGNTQERLHAKRFEAFPQTIKSMSPAMGNFERLLLDGRLVHDNPVLSMCVSHSTIRMDAAGNRAPDMHKATHRIDARWR